MTKIQKLAVFLAVAFVAPIEAYAETMSCLPHTAPMRGELRLIKTRHPAGYSIEAMQLVFRPPICVVVPALAESGRLEQLDVREMHIVPQKQFLDRLKRSLGRMVTARGDIGETHTAWHQGDAIMFDAVVLHIED